MAMNTGVRGATFSEHWHRVAKRRFSISRGTRIARQRFMGETWFVVSDPVQSGYHRLHASAYRLLARMDGRRTVEDVWREEVRRDPERAPTQDELIRLLAQMQRAGLFKADEPLDASVLETRADDRERAEWKGRLGGGLSIRVPLWNPDRFLQKTAGVGRMVFGLPGLVLWVAMVILGLKSVLEHWMELRSTGAGVLAPTNMPWLFVAFGVLKLIHEAGHAYACRRFGCPVRECGVLLVYFMPMPYVDTTTIWGLRSRWGRVLVGAAGMGAELFVAAVAAVAWAAVGDPVVRGFSYNLMVAASVSTLLFNGNPLMRFDSYYILSDLTSIPNLHAKATEMLRWVTERCLFGARQGEPPTARHGEGVILFTYGLASAIYRVVVVVGLIVWVSGRYLVLGLLLALAGVYALALKPVTGLLRYLSEAPSIERVRSTAKRRTLWLALATACFLALVPMPRWFIASGVVEAAAHQEVNSGTAGLLQSARRSTGARSAASVALGDELALLVNPELDIEMRGARAGLDRARLEMQLARETAEMELGLYEGRIAAEMRRVDSIRERIDALSVRAPIAGMWAPTDLAERLGRWVPEGEGFGMVLDPSSFRFVAVVSEADAGDLFSERISRSEVRLRGQPGICLSTKEIQVLPANQRMLPSQALGWKGGGDIEVAGGDPDGLRAIQPFFEVRVALEGDPHVRLIHGRTGRIRFSLPPEPLLTQAWRKLEQFLQKRYLL